MSDGELKKRILKARIAFINQYQEDFVFNLINEAKKDILSEFNSELQTAFITKDGIVVIDTRDAEAKLVNVFRKCITWFGE